MHDEILCYLMKGNQVLLGLKKRGFGADKWNGYGGKVNPGETLEEATKREVLEEVGVELIELTKVAEIDFSFPDVPVEKDWNQIVHVFISSNFSGEPVETEEMRPEWFKEENMPYEQFWPADKYWFPSVLAGKKVKARIVFGGTGETVLEYEVKNVDDFDNY